MEFIRSEGRLGASISLNGALVGRDDSVGGKAAATSSATAESTATSATESASATTAETATATSTKATSTTTAETTATTSAEATSTTASESAASTAAATSLVSREVKAYSASVQEFTVQFHGFVGSSGRVEFDVAESASRSVLVLGNTHCFHLISEEFPDGVLLGAESEVAAEDGVRFARLSRSGSPHCGLIPRVLHIDLTTVESDSVRSGKGFRSVSRLGILHEGQTLRATLTHYQLALGHLAELLKVFPQGVFIGVEGERANEEFSLANILSSLRLSRSSLLSFVSLT